MIPDIAGFLVAFGLGAFSYRELRLYLAQRWQHVELRGMTHEELVDLNQRLGREADELRERRKRINQRLARQ